MLDPLTSNSTKSSIIQTAGSSQMQQKVAFLEQQINLLNKIIMQKDETFNNILLAFQSTQYKHSLLMLLMEQHFTQAGLQKMEIEYCKDKFMPEEILKIKKLVETVLWDLQRVLNATSYQESQYQSSNRMITPEKAYEFETQSNDTSLDQNDNKKIYEVPIEMVVYKNQVEPNAQGDLEPSRSFIYEVPIQFQTIEQIPVILDKEENYEYQFISKEREIYQVSVQIDQIYEIPGQLNQFTDFSQTQQDYIVQVPFTNNLVVENKRLNDEIECLQEQIRKLKQLNGQLQLQKQKVITVEVPVRVFQLVQTPIELQPFEVNYVQQTTYELREVQTQTDKPQEIEYPSKIIYQKEVIVKQVPIELFVQRLVQIPVEVVVQRVIQVPIEVVLQKTIEKIVQIPIEVVLQKTIEKIVQIPIEVVIQKTVEKIVQVPFQVMIQKTVEVPKIQIRQTPIEVFVEKQVYIQVQKLVPILVPIIKEVPIEVQMQAEPLQIQKIVPIYVPIIKEVPIQVQMYAQFVQIQIVKQVKNLVEVPVIVYLQPQKPSLNMITEQCYESMSQYSCRLPQESNSLRQSNYQLEHSNTWGQKCKVFQLPIEVELQTIVQVERVVQKIVEKEVIVERLVEVVVQKVVEVQKIVEVIVHKIVQIPTECEMVTEQVQQGVSCDIWNEYKQVELNPVPVTNMKQSNEQILQYFAGNRQNKIQSNDQSPLSYRQDLIIEYVISQHGQSNHHDNSYVVQIFMEMAITQQKQLIEIGLKTEEQVELEALNNQQTYIIQIGIQTEQQITVTVQNTQQKQMIETALQTEEQLVLQNNPQKEVIIQVVEKEIIRYIIKQIPVECLIQIPVECISQIPIELELQHIQQTPPVRQQIMVYELPIELELVQNQIKRRQQQVRYQQYFNYMKQKYEDEITQLHNLTSSMQTVIVEKNIFIQTLQQQQQTLALKIQEIQRQHQQHQRQVQIQQNQQRQNIEKVTILEIPVQINLAVDGLQAKVQTQDLQLFQNIQVIEVPLQLANIHQITIDQLQHTEQQPSSTVVQPIHDDQHHGIIQIESEIIQKQEEECQSIPQQISQQSVQQDKLALQIPVKIQAVPPEEQVIQKDQIIIYQLQIYELPVQINLVIDTTNNKVQTDIQKNQQIQHTIYEVPVQIYPTFDTTHVQVQTEFKEKKEIEHCIYEVPIEFLHVDQYLELQLKEPSQQINAHQQLIYSKVYQFNILPYKTETNAIQLQCGSFKQNFKQSLIICEIPVELQMADKHSQGSQITTNTCQTQKKILTICKQIEFNQILKVYQQVKKIQVYPKLSIFNSIENIIVSPQQHPNISIQSQDKLQNKIIRLGQDIILNFQSSSQVQSLTPGMLGSQQDLEKFPLLQINSISAIQKDSLSEGKLIGSLELREELLSQVDPIEQVREAHKKLTGFQQYSSQRDNNGSSEQMIIEQSETVGSKDMIRIQTPNLEADDLSFSQYAKFQERNYHNEEQNHKYIEQNQYLNTKIVKLLKQLQKLKEDISKLGNLLEEEELKHQNSTHKLQNELAMIKKQKEALELQIQEYQDIIDQKQESQLQLQKRNDLISEKYQKLKYDALRDQKEISREVESLHNLLLQKQNQVKDAKMEAVHHKQVYENEISELREYLIANKEQIQKLYEEIQNKNEKIDQLEGSLEQLRKSVALMKYHQTDTSAIYEQEFQRIRYDFEQEKRQKDFTIERLQTQIEQLNIQLSNEQTKNKELTQTIGQLQKTIQEMRREHSKLHHLKSQIEDQFIVDIKQLKYQIEFMSRQIIEKEEIIKQHTNIQGLSVRADQNQKQGAVQNLTDSIKIKNAQDISQLTQYCTKLESIILTYQQKLLNKHEIIEQLQEKVCEYLSDALFKQQQAQNLYLKMISFENTINELLIEKVSLELQNRKQAKYIEQAEKKLKILGNRLIQYARQRAQYDSGDDQDYAN